MKSVHTKTIHQGNTIFLKLVLLFLALSSAGLSGLLLYVSLSENEVEVFHPIVLGMCVSVPPFILGLYQAYKLLVNIDRNTAFSESSLIALKRIKVCAFIISAIYAFTLPFFYMLAQIEDAPGLVVIGMILVSAPFVVAIFASVLFKLFQSGIEMKTENELTV